MRSIVKLLAAGGIALLSWSSPSAAQNYTFEGGYPTPETVWKAYDEADLNRAVRAYRFFYATVSSAATWNENLRIGAVPNQRFGLLETQPRHVGFTLNSDTPYGGMLLDLHAGPLVIELPEGPLLGAALDINQRWIADMGLPGPDAGRGGRQQARAALRSLFELTDLAGDQVDLYFGPTPPEGRTDRWVQTIPGRGWFVYFRVYGPEPAVFDGSWKPGDFEAVQ